MRCPNCDYDTYHPLQACPRCHFRGEPALVEELAHIGWLLKESEAWPIPAEASLELIRQKYAARQYELEVSLGLRLPRFNAVEAQAAWSDLVQGETLLQHLAQWQAARLISPARAQAMFDRLEAKTAELQQRLEGYARPRYPETPAEALHQINFLLKAVEELGQMDGFTGAAAVEQITQPLAAEKERLELELGLRSLPEPVVEEEGPEAGPQPAVEIEPGAPVAAGIGSVQAVPVSLPAAPTGPLLDRLWRTLLSERTLQALLFLGIFLLFSAALSFVIWGWQEFSAPLRVTIPTGFTGLFFSLGWYVRTRTHLYRSGIALSAIAALLIPIDFYTIYVNLSIPADYGPFFWFITSLICLAAYSVITMLIRSRFFGYLVGVAAGSTALAVIELGHQALGLSPDWRTAGLSVVSLGLVILATMFDRDRLANSSPLEGQTETQERGLAVLAEPFRYLALLTVGVLMPLTFGWRFVDRAGYDTLHMALTVNWWAGGLVLAWGAVHYRSRSLGLLAAVALPVATYLMQAGLFERFGLHPAWHGLGWSLLVPLYFLAGFRLLRRAEDPVVYAHGRTAVGGGAALLFVAALWSLTDLSHGAAAASSHAVLAGAIILAGRLWKRPGYLYGASLLLLSAATFGMSELDLPLSHLSLGWAGLAIAHLVAALRLGTGFPTAAEPGIAALESKIPRGGFVGPVVKAGYAIAALSLLPPLYPYNGPMLAYALGNWLGLSAWGSRLAHGNQAGFFSPRGWTKSTFHWFTSLPLPVWLWILFTNRRPADFTLALALAALAWGMVALSYQFGPDPDARHSRRAWYLPGLLVSIAAPVAAFVLAPHGFTPALVLLLVGLLYLSDALGQHQSLEMAAGGALLAWGYGLLLDRSGLSFDAVSTALAGLVAAYLGGGLVLERLRTLSDRTETTPGFSNRFFSPFYLVTHILSFLILGRVYIQPLVWLFSGTIWTDEMRLWGAASQVLLAVVYGLYAWVTYQERWGHLAAWLVAGAGGFITITYSHGHGSSAVHVALLAVVFVLAERSLYQAWRQRQAISDVFRQYVFFRLTWRLYRRPLLITGWVLSGVAVGLALVRNLLLLGGGWIQQVWAAAGLLLVCGLYGLSAWLFRQARFVWLSALLLFAPWTILTHLGWFTSYRVTAPGYALSWVILIWALFLAGLAIDRLAPAAYSTPVRVVAHLFLPLSLLWGAASVETSRFTFGLASGLYGLTAFLDFQRLRQTDSPGSAAPIVPWPAGYALRWTKGLYPALGLLPVWGIYLLAWWAPAARHESFGLLLLALGPLGLAAGRILRRASPRPEFRRAYALPAYLTGYLALIVGTMLVAHIGPLLALALLYDCLLFLVSARLFEDPLWVYAAATLAPVSLLIAVAEAGIDSSRSGWWLIGLASIYLLLGWALRRVRLETYGNPPLVVGFALIALGLPPSSLDQVGALWGYGAAAVLYTICAFWLRQPLLLWASGALLLVPYTVSLKLSSLDPGYYGLALFPGAIAALAAGWRLDGHFGGMRGFPWIEPQRWGLAVAERLLNWWALPLFCLGFGLATASPLFTARQAGLAALNLALLMLVFGWAVGYFRGRGWLLAAAVAGQLAVGFLLAEGGWWSEPASAWLRFLPVTLFTAAVALFIEIRRGEGSPLQLRRLFSGWSRPLYIILLIDIILGQSSALGWSWAGVIITLVHSLLIAILSCVWLAPGLAYTALALSLVALFQRWGVEDASLKSLPVMLAQLTLAYGLVGYTLWLIRMYLLGRREMASWLVLWERPLQKFSLGLSLGVLALMAWFGLDIIRWTTRAILGFPFRDIVDSDTVLMVIYVLGLVGLLYVAASFCYRRLRLGYVALGMLLGAWVLFAFYLQQWDRAMQIQLYALPAGVYLLAIAYMEWQRGNRSFARWLDYAAMLLMLGSLFWQTLLFGWGYAFLLGAEGFGAFWWGSARRLRRFFYAGMAGVILATVGQLINALRSINQWIVFGLIGLVLVVVAIVVERKLEEIKAWQEVLESWE